jgi:late competence protein required for DNA uptake (superfamily II DNA/RNA helicase)
MGAYKQFLSTDVIVSPLVVNKSFSFEGSASFTTNGIGIYLGTNYTSSNLLSSSVEYDQSLKYNSIKQLYYTNYIPNPISGSPYITDFNGNVVEDTSKLMFIVDSIIMNLQHYSKLILIFIHQIMVMKDFFQLHQILNRNNIYT